MCYLRKLRGIYTLLLDDERRPRRHIYKYTVCMYPRAEIIDEAALRGPRRTLALASEREREFDPSISISRPHCVRPRSRVHAPLYRYIT